MQQLVIDMLKDTRLKVQELAAKSLSGELRPHITPGPYDPLDFPYVPLLTPTGRCMNSAAARA